MSNNDHIIEISSDDETPSFDVEFDENDIVFEDKHIWGFSSTNARFQIKALKRLKEIAHGYPSLLESMEAWHDTLDLMIDGFQAILDLDDKMPPAPVPMGEPHLIQDPQTGYYTLNPAVAPPPEWFKACRDHEILCMQRFEAGLVIYGKYYMHLWD